jgi:hypothetical protein
LDLRGCSTQRKDLFVRARQLAQRTALALWWPRAAWGPFW